MDNSAVTVEDSKKKISELTQDEILDLAKLIQHDVISLDNTGDSPTSSSNDTVVDNIELETRSVSAPQPPVTKVVEPRKNKKHVAHSSHGNGSNNTLVQSASFQVEKKGPGRPRKVPKKVPDPRRGISIAPMHKEYFLEFFYDQPLFMKKIFQFFKSVFATEIQITMDKDTFRIYGYDHFGKTKIRCSFDLTKLNHYYCAGPLDIGVNCVEFNKAIDVSDKESQKVYLLSQPSTLQKDIQLLITNECEMIYTSRIQLITLKKKMDDVAEFGDEDYTISMELPTKRFKKIISDIKTISDQMSIIQADNTSNLCLDCRSDNKKIHQQIEFKSKSSINLTSSLERKQPFRVDVIVDHIKQISSSLPSDTTKLMFHENKKIKTISYLDDKTVEIVTLTSIINNNPNKMDM
jgi:hypothetical protein